jgi:hypothetical protein
MTSTGFYSDVIDVQTPWMPDLDAILAVACRLKYMQEHVYPAEDIARLEAFGNEFHRRREAALAPIVREKSVPTGPSISWESRACFRCWRAG